MRVTHEQAIDCVDIVLGIAEQAEEQDANVIMLMPEALAQIFAVANDIKELNR